MKNRSIPTLVVLIFATIASLFAQSNNEKDKTSKNTLLDSEVIHGKLANGMTYYIRSNKLPANRADFYIVFNVGAILEDDNQDGLAHLTEHMAFNGTKNFPKKGILDFLEKNGVAFGHNVNAFTAQDVTAYNLNDVPVSNEAIIDTSLMILHDWSNYIEFEDEEIDAERKVVHEEWRTRRNANFRMNKKVTAITLKASKYAKRDVIGSLDVIDNCKYETLKSFYKDWYRPDLEALIIVGDFNAKEMEQKVIEMFSTVPKVENPRERKIYEIPNNTEPLIAIASDKEAQRNTVKVTFKHDIVKPENKDESYLKSQLITNLYNSMINARLGELVQNENPPFIVGYTYYGGIVRSKNGYTSVAIAKDNEIPTALTAILQENERIKQHGFTEGEFERAKKDKLRSVEKAYKERNKMKNNEYVWNYFANFLSNEPAPSVEYIYNFTKETLATITLSQLNALPSKWVTDNNIIVSVTGIEKEGVSLPTKNQVLSIIKTAQNTELKPYVDTACDEDLMTEIPKPVKIINTNIDKKLDTETWTLPNGAVIVVKKTDFKEDEILMNAYSFGGSSVIESKMLPSTYMTPIIVSQSGIADFNNVTINKMLAGKVVGLNPYISTITEGFSGATSPNDLETFMQILHLYFSNPRFDSKAYNAYMGRLKPWIQNNSTNPKSIFNDSISYLLTDRNPRKKPMNLDRLNKVDFEEIKTIYNSRFADVSDFKFFFVGNINTDELKKMVETYIGSLEGKNKKEQWKDNNVRPPKNNVKNEFKVAMETPKATVFVNYNKEIDYTPKNIIYLKALKYILGMRYTKTIREEQGGSYGVRVSVGIEKYPYQGYGLNVQFDCDPDRTEQLKSIVFDEVDKLWKKGASKTDVDKTIEYFIKTHEENLKENGYWVSALVSKDINDVEIIGTDYEEIVRGMTVKKLKKFAKKTFRNSKNVEVIMLPKK
ncbi:MAG: insulinase family protein [Ichthyobacteriaceae bacterium]|nr:insulinase family protein [Ichthyobacteriaceae bacterium]